MRERDKGQGAMREVCHKSYSALTSWLHFHPKPSWRHRKSNLRLRPLSGSHQEGSTQYSSITDPSEEILSPERPEEVPQELLEKERIAMRSQTGSETPFDNHEQRSFATWLSKKTSIPSSGHVLPIMQCFLEQPLLFYSRERQRSKWRLWRLIWSFKAPYTPADLRMIKGSSTTTIFKKSGSRG